MMRRRAVGRPGDANLSGFGGGGLSPFSSLFGLCKSFVVKIFEFVFEFVTFLYRYAQLGYHKTRISYGRQQWVRYDYVSPSPLMLHRLSCVRRKVLVLDLDETLIHSHHDGVIRPMVTPGTPPDFTIRVTIDRHPVRFSVHMRPHVDFFLNQVAQWFDLVVFTASMEVYGSNVADHLDRGRGFLGRRYFRQHCTMDYGGYTKDLAAINSDLSSIFILDNSPGAYRKFPQNAIPIRSWYSDPSDTCLLNLLPVLDALRFCSDVRSILSRNQHLPND